MTLNLIGIDIGGTKCAVIYGIDTDGYLKIADKVRFDTIDAQATIARILLELKAMCSKHSLDASNTKAVGISCGGPLDSRRGVVMSPPNLPGWDDVPICKLVEEACGIKAVLQNDANACALAEWKYGAGRGSRNMVFLTFGTGLGAGLVLDGRLYSGTNDNAGELGHIRLSEFGPVGYGKAGSVEGFASGGGIAQLAASAVKEKLMMGEKVSWCPDGDLAGISAKTVAEAAKAGDELAIGVYRTSATYLGKALAMVIDMLNPEVILLGGAVMAQEKWLRPRLEAQLEKLVLPAMRKGTRIEFAHLGNDAGMLGALYLLLHK